MNNILDVKETLLDTSWIDEQAAAEPDREFAESENAIANHKEARKKNEAELLDLMSAVKMKASDVEDENRRQIKFAEEFTKQTEEKLATSADVDDIEIIQQVVLDSNLAVQTVAGGTSGRYYDNNPYHGWGRVDKHNEGGTTTGSADYSLAARKMYPYAHAIGDGSGISDDNDVTTWTKLYFAFWPRKNGHVRAYVPYYTRGYYSIYANDKWYNSKEAKIDLDVSVQLHQNYWGGYVKDDVFDRFGDNIHQYGRVDLNRSLYSGSLPIGENKWVIAEVAVRAHVETEGGGSTATLNFRSPDYIFVPYVRFDFS